MLQPRNRRHDISSAGIVSWRDGDPVAANVFDSLSALFPQGERFFIQSVRNFRDVVPADIAADVRGFIAQEAIHTREHQMFNDQITAAGFQIQTLEARTERQLSALKKKSVLKQLAYTVALEHFTAALANLVLCDPRLMEHAPPETARLWRWHAAEEIEHKAVAFDTLSSATSDWSAVERWVFRCGGFIEAISRLARVAVPNFIDLARQDVTRPVSLGGVARFFFVKPAFLLRLAPMLLVFFGPGFHPWKHDDAELAHAALAEGGV
jgi:predicted metal-dependent hydrolase